MATNATNFREYPRGAQPGDWRAVYGGPTAEPWRVRSVDGDPERSSWLAAPAVAANELLAWTVAEAEPGFADQEVLALLMVPGNVACRVLALRSAGSIFTPGYIVVTLDPSGPSFSVSDVAGGATVRLSGALTGFRGFAPWWVRLRANGTALSFKAWAYGTSEPGSWTATGTTTITAAGPIGIPRGTDGFGCETLFFSYGTGGDTAPGPSAIPAGLATWSLDPDAQVEITVELAGADAATGMPLPSLFASTHGRFTRASDFPAAAEMPALLLDPGSLALRLAEDLLYGPADGSLGKVKLRNDRNQWAHLMERTLAGYRLTARAGLASWASHRWFEPVYSSLMDGEPPLQDQVEIALQAAYAQLTPNLSASRYSGIPTGLQLNGAGHAAPHLAAYDLTSFLVSCRLTVSGVPGADVGLQKATSFTAENFFVGVEGGTGYYIARASLGGMGGALLLRSSVLADGKSHQLAFGVDSTATAYLLLDGVPVVEALPSGLVDTPAAGIALVGFTGQSVWDLRVLSFCPSIEEAGTLLATRAQGDDEGMVGFWPCDDGAGATATDYAAAGNSVALAGTVNVNYTWIGTDQGEPDQAGTQVQIAAGKLFNAPALLIDHNRQRVRLNDGALPGVVTLKTKGVVVAGTDLGDGCYQFSSLQSEPITFDQGPTAGGSEDHMRLATVVEALLTARMGLAEDAYDAVATRALAAVLPFNVQFFAAAEVAGRQALDDLLGPVAAHYRLDRDGRIVPGILLPPVSPGPVPGDAVLELLGTAGRSRVAWGDTSADLPSGSWTIAFWVKSFSTDRWTLDGDGVDPFPSYAAIANNLSGAGGGYYVGLYRPSQGAMGFKIPFLTGSPFITPPGTVQWGDWTFLACRYNSATSTLSIWAGRQGGVMVKVYERPSTTGTPIAAAQGLELGGRLAAGAQGSLAGSVAHYQVRNAALSDAAIQALFAANGVPTLPDASVLFYSPLNDGFGPQALDLISGTYGRIWGARWAPRLVLDFRVGLSASTFKVKTLRPAWSVLLHYGRNLHPMTDADIAAVGVSATDRGMLKREWKVQPAADRAIKAAHRNAREIGGTGPDGTGELDSPIMDRPAAIQTARTIRQRFAPGMVQGAVENAPRATLSLGMTDEVLIYHPTLPGSRGAACRVVGLAPTFRNLRSGIDLWGVRLPSPLLTDEERDILADDGRPLLID